MNIDYKNDGYTMVYRSNDSELLYNYNSDIEYFLYKNLINNKKALFTFDNPHYIEIDDCKYKLSKEEINKIYFYLKDENHYLSTIKYSNGFKSFLEYFINSYKELHDMIDYKVISDIPNLYNLLEKDK